MGKLLAIVNALRTAWAYKDKIVGFVQKVFRNDKKTLVAVVGFVAVMVMMFSCHARAEDTSTLSIEGGSAMLRGETPTIGLTLAWPEAGPIGTGYEFGFDLIGASHYKDANQPNQIQLRTTIVDGWKNAEMGFGFYWQNVPSDYVCQFGFHLMARYKLTDRLSTQWRHSSSAGSCRPNAGRDLLTVSWRF